MLLVLRRHVPAMGGLAVLGLLYLCALLADVVGPYSANLRDSDFSYAPPQRIRLLHEGRLVRPFVYGYLRTRDQLTRRYIYQQDTSVRYPVRLLTSGVPYRLWGLIPSQIHLFGIADSDQPAGAERLPGRVFLFGADQLGRCVFSRVVHGAKVSLTIGLTGVALAFVIGVIMGAVSGYYGGAIDLIVQRVIEFFLSIPTIPLWLALAAALPPHWDPVTIYWGVTLILSVVGWAGLARVVRGLVARVRNADFVVAAKLCGAPDSRVLIDHILPSASSYLIVNLTLAVPNMILGETALSFLGIGIRAPAVSWGVLLQDAQQVATFQHYPWLLIPAMFVVVAVLCFNMLGDGLRDASDPLH